MGQVIDARERFRRIRNGVHKERFQEQVGEMSNQVGQCHRNFARLVEKNLPQAINELPSFIDAVRNGNYHRALVESIAGGPNADWIVPLFNLLSENYELLEHATRKKLLETVLEYLDRINTQYAQTHVRQLQNPALIGDVILNRWIYWPGCSNEVDLLLKCKDGEDLMHLPDEIIKSFWMAIVIMSRGQQASDAIRSYYHRYFPEKIEKAIFFSVAHICQEVQIRSKDLKKESAGTHVSDENELIERALDELYDPQLHERIKQKLQQQTYILLPR